MDLLLFRTTVIHRIACATISGRNGNSELAQACANEELCHEYMTFNTSYKDTGLSFFIDKIKIVAHV